MTSHLQDIADVRAVVQLYIDGASGDPAKLEEAFHPDAHMFGHIGDQYDLGTDISDFIGMVASSPSMAGPNYAAEVRTVDVVGDAGGSGRARFSGLRLRRLPHAWLASMVDGGSPTRPTHTSAVRYLRADCRLSAPKAGSTRSLAAMKTVGPLRS